MSYTVFACLHLFMCVCMSEICLQVDSYKNCDDVKLLRLYSTSLKLHPANLRCMELNV